MIRAWRRGVRQAVAHQWYQRVMRNRKDKNEEKGAAARGIPTSSALQLELARTKTCRPSRITVEQQAEGVGIAAGPARCVQKIRGGEKDLCCNSV